MKGSDTKSPLEWVLAIRLPRRDAKYRQEAREGKHNVKAKRIRFETFSTKYLDHAGVNKKPKSAKRNEVSIGQLMPYFKGKLLGSIHPFQVEQYKKAEGRRCVTSHSQ